MGLAFQAKGQSCHTKNQSLPNYLRKKASKSAKHRFPLRYKKDPLKTMYLDLNSIVKLKFTTNYDRCAMLNVLNCLAKNFEP